MTPDFKARAANLLEPLGPVAEKVSAGIAKKFGNAVAGAIVAWGAVVMVGGVLMAHASREDCCAVDPPAATAATEAPKPAPVLTIPKPAAAAPIAAAPEAPAPSPVAIKTTQRVDMSPTAAIPADPPAKPKHKPHKKKPKDLDSAN